MPEEMTCAVLSEADILKWVGRYPYIGWCICLFKQKKIGLGLLVKKQSCQDEAHFLAGTVSQPTNGCPSSESSPDVALGQAFAPQYWVAIGLFKKLSSPGVLLLQTSHSPGSSLEMQSPGPTPDLRNQNLLFNQFPGNLYHTEV